MRTNIYRAALVLAPFGALCVPAAAQEAPREPDEAIIVTGTRAPNRTAAESAVPIDVFSADDLAEPGYLELGQALQRIAPSLNLPQATIGATAAVRAATLRGLAPDQTLVLINGKRRHAASVINTNNSIGRGSVSTDLSLIPLAAIKRVEVLRDGASAQYGSDAIAGVVNIILDDDSDALRFSMRGRKTEREGGLGGQLSASGALKLGSGTLRLTAEISASGRTNNALPNLNGTPATNPNYGKVTGWFGDPRTKTALLAANLRLPVGETVELYGYVTAARRDVDAPGFFRDPAGSGGPFTAPDLRLIFPNGFLPVGKTRQLDAEAYLGLRGALGGGWDWDVSSGLGYNRNAQDLERGVNGSLGAASPTKFYLGAFRYKQWKSQIEVSRSFDWLDGASLALGASHRYENFSIQAGDAASRFEAGSDPSRGLDPASPIDESRNSVGFFADGEIRFTQAVRLEGAVRYEHYSTFGDTVTGKLAGYVEPFKGFSLRGSISTGFRAPSLQQSYYTTVNRRTDPATASVVTVGTYPVDSPAAIAVGARLLEPETSRQIGFGIGFRPLDGLSITADYFNTRIKNRITLSEQLSGVGATPGAVAVRNALAAAGIRNVTALSFFTNALDTTTEGVEIAAHYRRSDVLGGTLALTGAYTHYRTKIDRLRGNEVVPQLPLLGQRSLTLLTSSQPETKASFDTSFTFGRFDLSALATYYSGYTVSFGDEIPIGDEVIVDLTAGARLSDALRLSFGVQNLFDQYPDVLADRAATQGPRLRALGQHYPEESPFGNNGRTFVLSLTAEF